MVVGTRKNSRAMFQPDSYRGNRRPLYRGFVACPQPPPSKHDTHRGVTRALLVQITRYRSELLFERKGKKERKRNERNAGSSSMSSAGLPLHPYRGLKSKFDSPRRSGKSLDFSILFSLINYLFSGVFLKLCIHSRTNFWNFYSQFFFAYYLKQFKWLINISVGIISNILSNECYRSFIFVISTIFSIIISLGRIYDKIKGNFSRWV